jgi:hypothetical protein
MILDIESVELWERIGTPNERKKKVAVVGKDRVGAQRRMISDNDAVDAVRSKEGKKH